MFLKRYRTIILAFGAVLLLQAGTSAQNVRVAIAANLQPVIKMLQQDFLKRTGITIDAISGPSGNLATQIRHGAPFDIFLSADTDFPEKLYKSGLAANAPIIYARGALVICSSKKLDYKNWPKLLTSAAVFKIAIGNPAIAPYGKAAREALIKAGIYDQVKSKIVLGESISQVNTYITTGVVQAGFTTLALIKDPANKTTLSYTIVDTKAYRPIQQGMVLLKSAANNANAVKFYRYITSAPAKIIFKQYGYHVQ